ncbi:hypothetical protein ACFYP6_21960 [Streptomyces goshikiensis]|uniref:hypothetical protein n=1 Tax=Streptomyces goshikiensis TaxID=1942 RepID=UPI0036AB7DD8
MPRPILDAQVRLALHPDHTSAVTATITGPDRYLARATLAEHGFRWTSDETMAMARIDHDEPHYADQAARALREGGTTVEIEPALQGEMETEWSYGNYPMHWLNQNEVREVSAEAQRIHDDIAAGRLTIHFFLGRFSSVSRPESPLRLDRTARQKVLGGGCRAAGRPGDR